MSNVRQRPDMSRLDEDAVRVLRHLKEHGGPKIEDQEPEDARTSYRESRRALSSDWPAMEWVRDLTTTGCSPLRLRCYRPRNAPKHLAPALIFFHGGGWVIGDLESHDSVCRGLANFSNTVVVAVDYRLGPEHKFPSAVEDAFAATKWIAGVGSEELDIDPKRLAVGGDSAGATLATVTSILARDLRGTELMFQLLIYPITDMRRGTESQATLSEDFLLTGRTQEWCSRHYLREEADRMDWRASPLLAADLSRLPPAWVLTAGYDPLYDEGAAYATRLADAGVSMTRSHYPGQIHGFITMGRAIAQANQAIAEAGDAVKQALHVGEARNGKPT